MGLSKRDWLEVRALARDKFHFDGLRPGQKEALDAVLRGKDTLAVLPTGSGKSAIYQIAGMMIPGPTVVVSPLIALQRDQREAIEHGDLGPVAIVNSMQPASERERAFQALEQEDVEFLLLAPEQFSNPETLERLRAAKPSLFVVDEAHCVSEWGHSFRPDYLRLGAVIDALGHPRTLALTATASPEVRAEICQRLHLREPEVIVTTFDRPNIHLGVRCVSGDRLKLETLRELIASWSKPGIVYTATRKHAEEVAQYLTTSGCKSLAYHAGLQRDDRNARQQSFMDDQVDVIVATSAFGMGIDKPNVRFVAHYDVSESLDAYYQEIGRAGRDGHSATAVLLFSERDLNLKRFFAAGGRLSEADVQRVLDTLRLHGRPLRMKDLAKRAEVSQTKTANAVARLEDQGALRLMGDGQVSFVAADIDAAAAIAKAVAEQAKLNEGQRARLEPMHAFARERSCRRALLLAHFGDEAANGCSGCDNCDEQRAERRAVSVPADLPAQTDASVVDDVPSEYSINTRVLHRNWGKGTVAHHHADGVSVLFDHAGEKQFSSDALRGGVLELAL